MTPNDADDIRLPEELVVEQGGLRLDKYLASAVPSLSRARLQTAIDAGAVTLNGRQSACRTPVQAGDRIRLSADFFAPKRPDPEDIPLSFLYEDDELAVIDKPAGMVVHPDAAVVQGTLVNAMLHHCRTPEYRAMLETSDRPGIVHRLDKDTSGLLVVAKTRRAMEALQFAFREHTIRKWYLALVDGEMEPSEGRIDLPLGPHPTSWRRRAVLEEGGKAALTEYRTLATSGRASLLMIRLHTGRTHQIRVHLSHSGHPVIGDSLYGGNRGRWSDFAARQLLHSWRLSFVHPVTRENLRLQAPLPDDFREALAKLQLKKVPQ